MALAGLTRLGAASDDHKKCESRATAGWLPWSARLDSPNAVKKKKTSPVRDAMQWDASGRVVCESHSSLPVVFSAVPQRKRLIRVLGANEPNKDRK